MPLREMDCMDCHNRPSHTFELPERAVDHAMRYGEISPALPFAKKKAVEILKAQYASGEDAARRIPAAFEEYYRKTYPALDPARGAEIARSGKAVAAIFSRNVFPEMNVKWGDYPNNIGHTDFPGCSRCHESNHKASDGKSIAEDCNACHNLLAMDEAKPKVLTDLGVVEARPPEQR
jgi:ssDNA-binding Zn-finger/Zn-ribbon topoisomerase 1